MLILHTSISGKKHKLACCIYILSFVTSGSLPHWSVARWKSMWKCRITKRVFNRLNRAELHPFLTRSPFDFSSYSVLHRIRGGVRELSQKKNCSDEGQKQPLSAIIKLSEVKGALFLFLSTDFCCICSHITYPLRPDPLLPLPSVRIKVGAELGLVFSSVLSCWINVCRVEIARIQSSPHYSNFPGAAKHLGMYTSPRERLSKGWRNVLQFWAVRKWQGCHLLDKPYLF